MIKKYIFFFLLFSTLLLQAEEWRINDFDIEVDGITNKGAIIRVSQLKKGQTFKTREDLENALRIAKDILDGERVFESVEVGFRKEDKIDDVTPVIIEIKVKDTWNLIALPYPKYDSNSGFEFSIRARDYNFLGLMEPLRIDFNYNYDEHGDHNFDIGTTYVFNFPIGQQNFSLNLGQNFYYKPEDSYEDIFYMSTSLSLGTAFTLPWDIYNGNKIKYSISTSVGQKYNFIGISEERDHLDLGFTHGFNLGQTSWNGNNFREGIKFSLKNKWSYDYEWRYTEGVDEDPSEAWDTSIYGDMQFHDDWYPLGYSGRIGFSQNLRADSQSGRGGPMRGILTSDIESGGFIYMNNGLYITVWNNKKIWEIMGGPTLDFAYMWDVPDDQEPFAWSFAVDGLCYPYFAKSFQARITVGFNGSAIMESDAPLTSRLRSNYELFFGLGHFF